MDTDRRRTGWSWMVTAFLPSDQASGIMRSFQESTKSGTFGRYRQRTALTYNDLPIPSFLKAPSIRRLPHIAFYISG